MSDSAPEARLSRLTRLEARARSALSITAGLVAHLEQTRPGRSGWLTPSAARVYREVGWSAAAAERRGDAG